MDLTPLTSALSPGALTHCSLSGSPCPPLAWLVLLILREQTALLRERP